MKYLSENKTFRIAALMKHLLATLGEENHPDEAVVVWFVKNHRIRSAQDRIDCIVCSFICWFFLVILTVIIFGCVDMI